MEKLISNEDLIKLKKNKCYPHNCVSYSSDSMMVGIHFDNLTNLPNIKNLIFYIQFYKELFILQFKAKNFDFTNLPVNLEQIIFYEAHNDNLTIENISDITSNLQQKIIDSNAKIPFGCKIYLVLERTNKVYELDNAE